MGNYDYVTLASIILLVNSNIMFISSEDNGESPSIDPNNYPYGKNTFAQSGSSVNSIIYILYILLIALVNANSNV
jgi:hypothetical protein